jgi:hypothetical protein
MPPKTKAVKQPAAAAAADDTEQKDNIEEADAGEDMASVVGRDSGLRDAHAAPNIVSIPKVPNSMLFDGSDYVTWAEDFRSLMELYDLWKEFEGDGTNEEETDDETAHSSRVSTANSRLAAVVLRSAIKNTDVKSLLNDAPAGDAAAMWRLLRHHYMQMTPIRQQ